MDLELPFSFAMPIDILKSEDGEKVTERLIQGFASTDQMDKVGEVLLSRGADLTPFLESGFIDWNHGVRLQKSFEYAIGEPVDAHVRATDNGHGIWMKAKLWEGNPHADIVWAHMERVARGDSQRPLSFSVEGKVRPGGKNGRLIKSWSVFHCAVTHEPVNGHQTFAQIAKSLAAGDATPFAQSYLGTHTGDGSCRECRDQALAHLVRHRGLDGAQAVSLLTELNERGLF